jgi:glutamine amidotransferase
MIVIIDYGLGNIGSLQNMLKRIGEEAIISSNKNEILAASKLILPGVGTFDTGMRNLKSSDLIDTLNEAVLVQKKNILGICLGAQLMLNESEEGIEKGLGWINGKVVLFNHKENSVKVPHMGWNNLIINDSFNLFNEMIENPPRFYFVHKYHFSLNDNNDVTSLCKYGYEFPASFQKENIYGVQFHPEKSHQFGISLLKNFIAA